MPGRCDAIGCTHSFVVLPVCHRAVRTVLARLCGSEILLCPCERPVVRSLQVPCGAVGVDCSAVYPTPRSISCHWADSLLVPSISELQPLRAPVLMQVLDASPSDSAARCTATDARSLRALRARQSARLPPLKFSVLITSDPLQTAHHPTRPGNIDGESPGSMRGAHWPNSETFSALSALSTLGASSVASLKLSVCVRFLRGTDLLSPAPMYKCITFLAMKKRCKL